MKKNWHWMMMMAIGWYGWLVFCLYMGVEWSVAMVIAVFSSILTCVLVLMTVDMISRFDVHKFVEGWNRRWQNVRNVCLTVVHSKRYMAGCVAIVLMVGHLGYLWQHDNGTGMRWCKGKGNLYAVHDYGDTHWVDDAKWGKVCIERCRFCTFERMHLTEYWYPCGEFEHNNVYVVKSRFSDSFDVCYQECYDKNKPEMQYRKIKEEEIVRMKSVDEK